MDAPTEQIRRLAEMITASIGRTSISRPENFFKAFDKIIDYMALGSFVIVGRALERFLDIDFEKTMLKSREYIIKGDKWYVCDIIGERSLGQSLIGHFDDAIPYFREFTDDENIWVRRSVGVTIHLFTKRVKNAPEKIEILLKLIEPSIGDKRVSVVKGIGWALKTIGKYYPGILEEFLEEQLNAGKRILKLLLRKATTYLQPETKGRIMDYARNLQS